MVFRHSMLKFSTSQFLYLSCLKVADALTVISVWYGCWVLRFESSYFSVAKGLPEFEFYTRAALPLMLLTSTLLHIVGAYRLDRIEFGFRAAKKVAQGSVLGTLVFVAACYFVGEMNYSRVFLCLFGSLLILALWIERLALHLLWRVWLNHFVQKIRVLCVGEGELLEMYVSKIACNHTYPVEWVGRLGLGQEERLAETILSTQAEQVVVSFPERAASKYAPVLEVLSGELVDVKVLPDFGKYSTFTYHAVDEFGIPLLSFNQSPVSTSDRALKRLVDLVGSSLLLLVFSPVYCALAIAIKLSSKGPIFFTQERVGADGTRFPIYKFRTMRTDAEDATGAVWAVKDDPRVTTVGKWMRNTSLDEIPQFLNVLRGEMSLVGPRPERPEFVVRFKREVPKYMLRHKMKSGITGWAQVNGWRGNTSIDERIKHDLYYIGHWSHLFDLKILCLTLIKGFRNENAY
jgi:exopolysaccharide biosynthesis polyprenyl glycosylphosphotransferase